MADDAFWQALDTLVILSLHQKYAWGGLQSAMLLER